MRLTFHFSEIRYLAVIFLLRSRKKSTGQSKKIKEKTLREKGTSTELFLVRIFLYSVRIQENTDQK